MQLKKKQHLSMNEMLRLRIQTLKSLCSLWFKIWFSLCRLKIVNYCQKLVRKQNFRPTSNQMHNTYHELIWYLPTTGVLISISTFGGFFPNWGKNKKQNKKTKTSDNFLFVNVEMSNWHFQEEENASTFQNKIIFKPKHFVSKRQFKMKMFLSWWLFKF